MNDARAMKGGAEEGGAQDERGCTEFGDSPSDQGAADGNKKKYTQEKKCQVSATKQSALRQKTGEIKRVPPSFSLRIFIHKVLSSVLDE